MGCNMLTRRWKLMLLQRLMLHWNYQRCGYIRWWVFKSYIYYSHWTENGWLQSQVSVRMLTDFPSPIFPGSGCWAPPIFCRRFCTSFKWWSATFWCWCSWPTTPTCASPWRWEQAWATSCSAGEKPWWWTSPSTATSVRASAVAPVGLLITISQC